MAYNPVSCLAHMACHLLDGIHPSTMHPLMLGGGRTCCQARVAMSGGESCCRIRAAMSGMHSIPPSSAGGWGNMLPGQSCRIWYAQHSTLQCRGVGRHVCRVRAAISGVAQRTDLHWWRVEKYIAWGTLHTSVRRWMVEKQFRAQSGLPCFPCCLI